jgi:hypothetical protein
MTGGCLHSHQELRTRIDRAGRRYFQYQCVECGEGIGSAVSAAIALAGGQTPPPFDESVRAKWWLEPALAKVSAELASIAKALDRLETLVALIASAAEANPRVRENTPNTSVGWVVQLTIVRPPEKCGDNGPLHPT